VKAQERRAKTGYIYYRKPGKLDGRGGGTPDEKKQKENVQPENMLKIPR